MLECLHDTSITLRETALDLVGRFSNHANADMLLVCLHDKGVSVRKKAIQVTFFSLFFHSILFNSVFLISLDVCVNVFISYCLICALLIRKSTQRHWLRCSVVFAMRKTVFAKPLSRRSPPPGSLAKIQLHLANVFDGC